MHGFFWYWQQIFFCFVYLDNYGYLYANPISISYYDYQIQKKLPYVKKFVEYNLLRLHLKIEILPFSDFDLNL